MFKRLNGFRAQTWSAYLYSFIYPDAKNKFIVFAQGRTGSWLLRDLLNCHPAIHADKEVLQWPVMSDQRVLSGLSALHRTQVYGCHLQIKQIRDVQRQNLGSFLADLHSDGWKIIYLRRENYLRQSVSSMVAVHRQLWKSRLISSSGDGINCGVDEEKHTLDCAILLEWLRQREANREQEISALSSLPFLELVYEEDLRCSEQHQNTAQRAFDYLGLKSAKVSSSLKRLGVGSMADQIENYEEVVTMLEASRYSNFLNEI